jgi:hypothetical protein
MLNLNQKIDIKLNDNFYKLALKYRINMINAQVDSDVETLDCRSLNKRLGSDYYYYYYYFRICIVY